MQNIENHIYETLTDNEQKYALEFVAYLRANNMLFVRGLGYWEDKRYWWLKYKDESVCFVLLNGYGEKAHKDEPEGWIIWSDDSGANSFEDYPIDEQAKEVAWGNVDYCGHCGGECEGGKHKTVFGKGFEKVCNTIFRFDNPNAEMIECAKKIVEIRKSYILRNI
ncbi:hypothetical protein FACS189425_00900 [Clostridia bacterium]|nr:hypothetical protein FACS189425_00900 [Clostridia bacterium]